MYSVGGGEAGAGKVRRARGPDGAVGQGRARFLAQARRLGVILAALFAIDLMTGGGWWVQWPALGMALYLSLRSGLWFERST